MIGSVSCYDQIAIQGCFVYCMQVLVCFPCLCVPLTHTQIWSTSFHFCCHWTPFGTILFLFSLLFICPVITSRFFTNHMMWEGNFLCFCHLCCFMWRVSLIVSYAPGCFVWGVSLIWFVLFYVGILSYKKYMPCVILYGEFLLHAMCYFRWGICLTCLVLFYVGSFSHMPGVLLCREFLLHASCYFMWGVSRIKLYALWYFMWGVFVGIAHCVLCGNFVNFVLHALYCFMMVVFILSVCLYKISILSRCVKQLPNWKKSRKEQTSLFCSQYLDWIDFHRGQLEFVSLCLPA